MPIEKGEDWGRAGDLPDGAPNAASDAALAALVGRGVAAARPTAGDLARTLGVSTASLSRKAATLLPLDAIVVTIDGDEHIAAAHVLVGSQRRPRVAVMNAAFVGDLNVAPRAHPGDGLLDVVTFDLTSVDWFKARRRMPTGGHVLHPRIQVRRVPDWQLESASPTAVFIDGNRHRRVSSIRCSILGDAIVAGV